MKYFIVSLHYNKIYLHPFSRRGKLQSGDIDALVTHPSLKLTTDKKKQDHKKILKNLVEALSGLVIDVISLGDTKFMVT